MKVVQVSETSETLSFVTLAHTPYTQVLNITWTKPGLSPFSDSNSCTAGQALETAPGCLQQVFQSPLTPPRNI